MRRFIVLVTGTLVYGKGDKLEAKREGLLEAGEERIFAPVAPAGQGETRPSAVPGQRRSDSMGTAPIAMRATPGSLKVCCLPHCTPKCTLIAFSSRPKIPPWVHQDSIMLQKRQSFRCSLLLTCCAHAHGSLQP